MERFWSKIKKGEGCWEWAGAKHVFGYGMFRFRGKAQTAHRVAWILSGGDISNGMCVLHRCDNPACCNPEHLFVGTNADNMRDKIEKGRGRVGVGERHKSKTHPESVSRGEANGRAKLKQADVIEIRELYLSGNHSYVQLARIYHVAKTTIQALLEGRTWQSCAS